jgi:hypothetical protein
MRSSIVRLISIAMVGVLALSTGASAMQKKGRWKKEGDKCVYVANDSGPNQCEPPLKGRFKKDGNKCVWEADDSGPDQCEAHHGRFKKRAACVWAPNDNGPNQCDPKQPR